MSKTNVFELVLKRQGGVCLAGNRKESCRGEGTEAQAARGQVPHEEVKGARGDVVRDSTESLRLGHVGLMQSSSWQRTST